MDPAWLNAVANVGAVTILGYFLTMTLPQVIRQFDDTHTAMIKSILADQTAERKAFGERADRLANAIDRLSLSFHEFVEYQRNCQRT